MTLFAVIGNTGFSIHEESHYQLYFGQSECFSRQSHELPVGLSRIKSNGGGRAEYRFKVSDEIFR